MSYKHYYSIKTPNYKHKLLDCSDSPKKIVE